MRQAFNFLRSYYDVIGKMENDKDKLEYILALLDKQFLGKEPNLTGIPDLVYTSQKYHINKSVEGYETKTNTKLDPPTQDPIQGSYLPSYQDPTEGEDLNVDNVSIEEGLWNEIDPERVYQDPYLGPIEGFPLYPSLQIEEEEEVKQEVKEEIEVNVKLELSSSQNPKEQYSIVLNCLYNNFISSGLTNEDAMEYAKSTIKMKGLEECIEYIKTLNFKK